MELNEMEEYTNKRKVLMPIKKPEELLRPAATIRPIGSLGVLPEKNPSDHSNVNSLDSNQKSTISGGSMNENNEEPKNALQEAIQRALSGPADSNPVPKTPSLVKAEGAGSPSQHASSAPQGATPSKGTRFFKFPRAPLPVGIGAHALQWGRGGSNVFTRLHAIGAPEDYVQHCGWHLHGASLWMGTSATGVTDSVGVNPASGATGFIPQAVKHIADLVKTSKRLSTNNGQDDDGNEYQFGVVAVLGGQDHAALLRGLDTNEQTQDYAAAFREINVPNACLKAALYNDMGKLFAFELTLGNPERYGRGRHLIFIHPANDIGGGKSDESLLEGRLSTQCSAMANEFVWWQAALERVGGKIGGIETTLGGTARIGRYALLSSRVPRSVFAKDAFESINIDRGDWVQENLQSQIQEYKANFATTLLRTVWGKVGERLRGFPVILTDRSDKSTQEVNKVRAQIAILRSLFLGSPELDLLRGDISDERIAIALQEGITDSQYMTIHDTVENDPKGPWPQQRRLRMNTTMRISKAKMMSLARADDPSQTADYAHSIATAVRGLATSADGALPAGGFCVLNAMIPAEMLNDESNSITKSTVSKALEALAKGLVSEGIDKPLIHLYQIPTGVGSNRSDIVVQILEDQTGTNVLIVSTEEAKPSEKRRILSNPKLKAVSNPYHYVVSAFNRLLGRCVEAHHGSGYHHCIEDGDLMMAFFRHYYGSSYGNRPNLILGGSNRLRNKSEGKGE
jgi:hypothetical protein